MRNTKGNRVQAEGPLVRPQAHTFSLMGNDAPTTAREWDLPSHGALTLFFRWRKKSVQKKASGTATPEAAHVAMRRGLRSAGALWAVLDLGSLRLPAGKRLLLPILTAGLATSRAISLASYLLRSRALLCSPFSAVKMGGLFSLRCLTPLCSLAVGTGRTQIAVLGSYSAAWRLRSAEKQTLFFPLQLAQGMLNQCQLGCCDMP